MSEFDLKAYTARAAELEAAVYTQKKLMGEHQTLMRNERPTAPQMPKLHAPTKPNKPNVSYGKGGNKLLFILAIPIGIGCIAFIAAVPIFGLIMTALCIYGLFNMFSGNNRDSENARQANLQYERDLQEYNVKYAQYQHNYASVKEAHSGMMQNYNVHVGEYDKKVSQITKKHDDALTSLENALQEHYSQNIIFPKYRNMVAITTINEYLMSGRCYELEGPNGAYNLYEMELRQNIIIGQLATIISSLEQIRNNQFSLYQELVKANTTVTGILHELHGVNENTRLTAYFAGVTALIEASPKVYIGRTF